MNRYLLLLTVLAWVGILSSCKTSHQKGPLAAQKEAPQDGGLPSAGNENEISAANEASPPALKGLAIETVEFQGDSVPLTIINAEVPTDFYEYRSCEEKQTCPHGTTPTNSFVLPGLTPGKHQVRVRACNNARSTTKARTLCGPWSSVAYTQTAQRNETTDRNLVERSSVEEKVKSLGQDVFDAVSSYNREIGSCKDLRIKKLLPMEVVKKYLRLGAGWIAEGLLDPQALLALISTAKGDKVVLVSSSTASLPGAVRKGAAPGKASADDDNNAQVRDVTATISSVAGAAALVTNMVRKELIEVAQKEGKNLAGDAGKAAKSKYEELAKNYGHTTRALRVLAIGGLVLYLSKTDEVKPEDLIKEFIKNAMLVSATTSCSRSVEAVQKILDADRQAAKLRQEIAAINEKFALTSAQP